MDRSEIRLGIFGYFVLFKALMKKHCSSLEWALKRSWPWLYTIKYNTIDLKWKTREQDALLTISHLRRGDYKPVCTELRSEYNLVITEPEVTNCFSINSVLKNNIIYKCCEYNLLHSSTFESNKSSCQKRVAWFCYFPVLNCQINCFRHLKGAFVFRK
jgi:hypothetical protein